MEHFSRSLKKKFKDKDLDEIEEILQDLISRKIRSVDVRTLSPVATMPAKIHNLLQVGARRVIELADAAVREMNREAIASTFVLARASFETTCLLFDANRRVAVVTHSDDATALEELDKFLMDVMMGFKSEAWGFSGEFRARNVLTIIERLAKQLDINLMWLYEGLSEHTHPNYMGMMGAYQEVAELGNPVIKFTSGPTEERDASMKLAIGGLSISLSMMQTAMGNLAEVLVPFAVLCERAIYEAGTWPIGVGYPIARAHVDPATRI